MRMTSQALKDYLRVRGVVFSGQKKGELAERAFWACKLGVPAQKTDNEETQEIVVNQHNKLTFDNGLVKLPPPSSLTKWKAFGTQIIDLSQLGEESIANYYKKG